jgi:hypothetical protein
MNKASMTTGKNTTMNQGGALLILRPPAIAFVVGSSGRYTTGTASPWRTSPYGDRVDTESSPRKGSPSDDANE